MILVDHVAGDPLGKLTFQRFGFSDAAEIFVFLLGVSCAIVYSGVLARRGWSGLLRSIARRAAYIYAFYLLTCIAVIFLTRAAASLTSASFNDDPFLVVIADPISAVQSAFLLTSPPALPGILVLYLMLTLIVIPLVLLISQRSAALALSVSAAIWTIAQFDPDLSPHLADHSVFDWLAWQFLFSIGMFVGLQRDHAWPIGGLDLSFAGERGLADCDRQPGIPGAAARCPRNAHRRRVAAPVSCNSHAHEREPVRCSAPAFPKCCVARRKLPQQQQSVLQEHWRARSFKPVDIPSRYFAYPQSAVSSSTSSWLSIDPTCRQRCCWI
jgi:hypothetical protein